MMSQIFFACRWPSAPPPTVPSWLKAAAGRPFTRPTPVTIPFELPRLDDRDEVDQLIALGKQLGKQLAIERARRWLGSQLAP